MATPRITMRKLRDILRLRLSAGLSIRQIHAVTRASIGLIQRLITRAEALGLGWPLPADLDDNQLQAMFYPPSNTHHPGRYEPPDCPGIHVALKHKTMTLQLLWEEYREQCGSRAYSRSQFCDIYRRWQQRQKRSLRQVHKAGEKCFVDYCGPTIPIVNPDTGDIRDGQVFVGVLGASNYTYAEATLTQSLPDWLASHSRMLTFFGGSPAIIVPDNLRSAVNKPCRYDPDLNPAYQQLAEHYGIAVIPARPYKPKDKAKAEVAVQIVERWIIARLRHHTFFSLAELNQCIKALLVELNDKPFKQLPGNRREAFTNIDQAALSPLPSHAYEYVDIKTARVNIDYHVQYGHHFYSVPHEFVGEVLELHVSDHLVTVYFRQRQVAQHPRAYRAGMTTTPVHMPERHQQHLAWTPERLTRWAEAIGPAVKYWVARQLEIKTHPEQAYRVCLGLLNLSKQYPATRLEAACNIANNNDLLRLKQIKSILKSNRDQLPEQISVAAELPQDHDNIRGPHHYH
ncbi:MAG: IS21 family transposase [Gammaproteobacteria bacterium]